MNDNRNDDGAPSWGRSWSAFWFGAVDPVGFHAVRVLAGLLFLYWLVPMLGHYEAFYGLSGWMDREAYVEASRLQGGSPFPTGWSYLFVLGENSTLLAIAGWVAVGVLALFTLGIAPRLTAVLTWLIVVSHMANPALHYDVDYLLVILAFYLMIGYLLIGQWSRQTTWLERILGPLDACVLHGLWGKEKDEKPPVPSHGANLALRLIQVHFAIVLVVGALHKFQFGDWWSGVALWYPANRPSTLSVETLRNMRASADSNLFFTSLATYACLAWQLAFPVFAFRRGLLARSLLLGGAAVGWLGLVFLYGLPYFGPLYAVVCLSYLTPGEWRGILGFGRRLWNRGEEAEDTPARKQRPVGKANVAV